MLLLLEATSTARKWKEKNEDVCFETSATTSARDDECSSNGSDQINIKCAKTQLMRYFEYYLNTCHVVAA